MPRSAPPGTERIASKRVRKSPVASVFCIVDNSIILYNVASKCRETRSLELMWSAARHCEQRRRE